MNHKSSCHQLPFFLRNKPKSNFLNYVDIYVLKQNISYCDAVGKEHFNHHVFQIKFIELITEIEMSVVKEEVLEWKVFFTKTLIMAYSNTLFCVSPVMCCMQIILFFISTFKHFTNSDAISLLRKGLVKNFHRLWKTDEHLEV